MIGKYCEQISFNLEDVTGFLQVVRKPVSYNRSTPFWPSPLP